MQNPIVAGRLSYGRTVRFGRGKRKALGPHDLKNVILSPVYPHLVIIDEAQWQQAMDRMANYNRSILVLGVIRYSRADSGPLLFTGMARCAHCNGPLVSFCNREEDDNQRSQNIRTQSVFLYDESVEKQRLVRWSVYVFHEES